MLSPTQSMTRRTPEPDRAHADLDAVGDITLMARQIQLGGALVTDADFNAQAVEQVTVQGVVSAAGHLHVHSDADIAVATGTFNTGTLLTEQALGLTAGGDISADTGSVLRADGELAVNADGTVALAGETRSLGAFRAWLPATVSNYLALMSPAPTWY